MSSGPLDARTAPTLRTLLALAWPAVAQTAAPADIAGHWAAARIELLLRRGVTQTFPDQTFRPDEPVARADGLRWLITAAGIQLRTPQLASRSFRTTPCRHKCRWPRSGRTLD